MKKIIFLLLVFFSVQSLQAQLTTRVVKGNLFIPWELVYGPDGYIWFTQKNGYVCRMNPADGATDTIYHETNVEVKSEGGMMGMALHHNFSTTPYVFVAYNYDDNGSYKVRVVRYEYAANTLSSPLTLIEDIQGNNYHNGCRLLEMNDMLYITTGDATITSTSQNIQSINGKTLRINIDGSIPTDNPIAGSPVWSWGHRNAQGMVYANGKLYQSEHGDVSNDEINIVTKSGNYGWPNVKGFCDLPAEQTFCNDSNVTEPIEAWTPTLAVCGIDYYDNPMFPQWQNSLLLTTLKDETLYQLQLNSAGDDVTATNVILSNTFGRLRDVCVSPDGKVYISTSNSNASGTGAFVDQIIELYDPSFNHVNQLAANESVRIYPNPATDAVTILVKSHKGLSYKLTGVDGRTAASGAITGNKTAVSLSGLAGGVYQLTVYSGSDKIFAEKILKQ